MSDSERKERINRFSSEFSKDFANKLGYPEVLRKSKLEGDETDTFNFISNGDLSKCEVEFLSPASRADVLGANHVIAQSVLDTCNRNDFPRLPKFLLDEDGTFRAKKKFYFKMSKVPLGESEKFSVQEGTSSDLN
ncbi:hypothetical protein [Pseudomonas aeruginosa]|uniref:hypothetical protein n=1 Tax=Pseudomonas aeruginosa TaxID=287 RepID=UPI0023592781|nr:hypothetical protein [Pseudomonas aeruginosa]